MQSLYKSRASSAMRRATIKRADAEPIQIKGQSRHEQGDNKREWAEGYTDQEPAEGGEAIVIKGP